MKLAHVLVERFHAGLLERLLLGQLDVETYQHEWDAIVSFCGWTWSDVLHEIDSRWDASFIEPSPAFLC